MRKYFIICFFVGNFLSSLIQEGYGLEEPSGEEEWEKEEPPFRRLKSSEEKEEEAPEPNPCLTELEKQYVQGKLPFDPTKSLPYY